MQQCQKVTTNPITLSKQCGTTIFEHMKVPKFDPHDDACKAIVAISEKAHKNRGGSRDKTFLKHEIEEELAEYVKEVCS